jgi:hypothetical protein
MRKKREIVDSEI